MDQRPDVQDTEISAVFKTVADGLQQRIKSRGKGAFMSPDEIAGRLDECLRMSKSALYSNESQMFSLLNLSVEALWSMMSFQALARSELSKCIDIKST